MGYRLYREVLDHAPAGVPHPALFVWLVIADDANDSTRLSMIERDLLLRRARLGRTALKKWLSWLGSRGYELRVVRGKDSDGQPVYAYRGVQANYILPRLAPEGADVATPLGDKGVAFEQKGVAFDTADSSDRRNTAIW